MHEQEGRWEPDGKSSKDCSRETLGTVTLFSVRALTRGFVSSWSLARSYTTELGFGLANSSTPLHVASELNRTQAAKAILKYHASRIVSGNVRVPLDIRRIRDSCGRTPYQVRSSVDGCTMSFRIDISLIPNRSSAPTRSNLTCWSGFCIPTRTWSWALSCMSWQCQVGRSGVFLLGLVDIYLDVAAWIRDGW